MNILNLFVLSTLVISSASSLLNSTTYDSTQLSTCVWLSGAAYCGKEKYPSMKLSGPASGFIYKDTLYDITAGTILNDTI